VVQSLALVLDIMKICLEEDNGFLHDGKPTLVVLVIDGKTRIPYEATKTIQELYVDVAKLGVKEDINIIENFVHGECPTITTGKFDLEKLKSSGDALVNALSEIEKEDIVKCIKVHPREEGAGCNLKVGNEYRVLSRVFDINEDGSKGKVLSYDIVDDNSKASFRIKCLPDEIELLRKRKVKTNPVKKDYVDKAWVDEKLAKSTT